VHDQPRTVSRWSAEQLRKATNSKANTPTDSGCKGKQTSTRRMAPNRTSRVVDLALQYC
jgi:hypothetical protein